MKIIIKYFYYFAKCKCYTIFPIFGASDILYSNVVPYHIFLFTYMLSIRTHHNI